MEYMFYNFYKLYFSYTWFSPFFKRNSTEILVGFLFYVILISFMFLYLIYVYIYSNFKRMMIINSALRVLGRRSRELDPIQGHATVVTCPTPGLECDNFISIKAIRFSKPF